MAQRVVPIDEKEFDEVMKGLDALLFEVTHTTAIRTNFTLMLIVMYIIEHLS